MNQPPAQKTWAEAGAEWLEENLRPALERQMVTKQKPKVGDVVKFRYQIADHVWAVRRGTVTAVGKKVLKVVMDPESVTLLHDDVTEVVLSVGG